MVGKCVEIDTQVERVPFPADRREISPPPPHLHFRDENCSGKTIPANFHRKMNEKSWN